MENNQKHIEEILKEAFASHEVEVGAHVWANVQAGMAANTAGAVATGATSLMKAASIVGLSTVTLLGGINEVVLLTDDSVASHDQVIDAANPAPQTEHAAIVSDDAWSAKENIQTVEPESSRAAEVEIVEEAPTNIITPALIEDEIADAGNPIPGVAREDASSTRPSMDGEPKEERAKDTKPKTEPAKGVDNAPPAKEDEESEENSEPTVFEDEVVPTKCAIQFTHEPKTHITPNGDGSQDCFMVQGIENVESFHIRIWTQAGELLAESSDVNFSWCGTDRYGKVLGNRSSCYYQVDAFDANGLQYKAPNARGHIMVFR
jgi:gliding motility-associated-like protein